MKDFLDLVAMQVVVHATDEHVFVALFDGPRGRQEVPIRPESLQDYETFQREALIGTGCLFRYFLAESMPREAANCCWRNYVDTHLAAFWRLNHATESAVN